MNLLNCLCCAGLIAGGFLGVFFYKSNFTPDTPVYSTGDCLTVGVLAGVFGALVATVVSAFSVMVFGNVIGEFLLRLLESVELDISPDMMEELQRGIRYAAGGGMLIFELFANLFIYPIFGLLGGLIGYAVWKPRMDGLAESRIVEKKG